MGRISRNPFIKNELLLRIQFPFSIQKPTKDREYTSYNNCNKNFRARLDIIGRSIITLAGNIFIVHLRKMYCCAL